MPFNIGCPSCASTNSTELYLSSCTTHTVFAVSKKHWKPFDHNIPITPHLCLDCGTIYIKRDDLKIIKKDREDTKNEEN